MILSFRQCSIKRNTIKIMMMMMMTMITLVIDDVDDDDLGGDCNDGGE